MKPKEIVQMWVQKTRDVIRRQGLALATERQYGEWLARYLSFNIRRPDEALTSELKAERYLTYLARERDVAVGTQMSAFFAIVYFYKHVLKKPLGNVDALRAKRPQRLRTAPSREETLRLLEALPDVGGFPTHFIGRILYARGLRVTEPLNVRLKDVRFDERKIYIRDAKGGKDRVVRMDEWMVEPLQRQIEVALRVLESDVRNGVPLEIPHQLAKKYPETRFSKHWAWLFPGHRPCRHPRTREMVRFRMHDANVQRAFQIAREKTGIHAVPHEMRHAHATHLLDRGTNIKALQDEMGHVDPRTTLGYCHASPLSVPSLLDGVTSTTGNVVPFMTEPVRKLA